MNSSLESRNEILISVADRLEDQRAKFVYLLMHEAGKTLEDALDEIKEATDFLRYYSQEILNLQSEPKSPTERIIFWNTGQRELFYVLALGIFLWQLQSGKLLLLWLLVIQ